MRYNIPLADLHSSCVCGKPFDFRHAFSCPRGGFVISRHNEIRDSTAMLLNEVHNEVMIEPPLVPLTGELFRYRTANTTDDAKSDIAVRGFWAHGTRAFLDVRIFNPLSLSYANKSLEACHKKNEAEKKRGYGERIVQVECGTFTPLVFSCYGGQGEECQRFYKELCKKLADKRKTATSDVVNFVRTRLSFTLVRSALICLRGSRRKLPQAGADFRQVDFTMANIEAGL